MADKEQAQQTI